MASEFSDVEKAYHEAGHATVAIALCVGIESVTIIPDHEFAGHVVPGQSIAEAHPAVVCSMKLAGALAAATHRLRTLDDSALIGAESDIESIQYIVGLLIDPSQRENFLSGVIRLSIQLLNQYWPAVVLIATALMDRKTLTGEQARDIFLFSQASQEERERLCNPRQ